MNVRATGSTLFRHGSLSAASSKAAARANFAVLSASRASAAARPADLFACLAVLMAFSAAAVAAAAAASTPSAKEDDARGGCGLVCRGALVSARDARAAAPSLPPSVSPIEEKEETRAGQSLLGRLRFIRSCSQGIRVQAWDEISAIVRRFEESSWRTFRSRS